MKQFIISIFIALSIIVISVVLILSFLIKQPLSWEYYDLLNNYSIQRKNSKDIHIIKKDKIVIEDYVLEVQYDKRYIMVKAVEQERIKKISKKEVEKYINYQESELNRLSYHYFIIDTETDEIKENLSKEEYEKEFEKIELDKDTLVYWFRMY